MRVAMFAAMTAAGVSLAAEPTLLEKSKTLFKPLPTQFDSKENPLTKEKIDLGRQLYFEKRMSKSQELSCNSCHLLAKYGVDNEPTSPGHKKQRGDRNSPTVFNAGNHIAQFWDGRAATLEDQAKGPVLNAVEMAMPDEKFVVKTIKSIPGYEAMFKKAFPGDKDPINYDNIAKAIGAFERTLVTPSRFDKFLGGDEKALTADEKKGLETYLAAGCTACHMGEGVGGAMYQKLGLVKPVPGLKDEGRSKVTKNAGEKYFFKVPSLRNIEKTGPYLHDGSLKTLEETIAFMGEYQLGKQLKKEEVASIATFLKSLTGDLPAAMIAEPKPLPGGKDTPKADPN